MVKISVREFTHHVSEYMERAHKGERFVIVKRSEPVADIVPHRQESWQSGWSLEKPELRLKDVSFSKELLRFRQEERS